MKSLTASNDSMNLDAHYSKNMKVKRPNVDNSKTAIIPKPVKYSLKETDQRYKDLSEDVFTSYQKEKTNHEFDFKTYFKIFCTIILAAGLFACVRFFKGK